MMCITKEQCDRSSSLSIVIMQDGNASHHLRIHPRERVARSANRTSASSAPSSSSASSSLSSSSPSLSPSPIPSVIWRAVQIGLILLTQATTGDAQATRRVHYAKVCDIQQNMVFPLPQAATGGGDRMLRQLASTSTVPAVSAFPPRSAASSMIHTGTKKLRQHEKRRVSLALDLDWSVFTAAVAAAAASPYHHENSGAHQRRTPDGRLLQDEAGSQGATEGEAGAFPEQTQTEEESMLVRLCDCYYLELSSDDETDNGKNVPDGGNSTSPSVSVCPATANTCALPVDRTQPIHCYQSDSDYVFVQNAWPLLILWFSFLLAMFWCSARGFHAQHYLWSCARGGEEWNEEVVAHVTNSQRANSSGNGDTDEAGGSESAQPRPRPSARTPMARTWVEHLEEYLRHIHRQAVSLQWIEQQEERLRERQNAMRDANNGGAGGTADASGTNQATSQMTDGAGISDPTLITHEDGIPRLRLPFCLPTKHWTKEDEHQYLQNHGDEKVESDVVDSSRHGDQSNTSTKNEVGIGGNGEACCAICIVDIEVGDRVGNLPCHHVFHVDCLKPWIKKQNACPLCHAKIVKPL
uniref:RING-type domain-containing protein n=1 Tax=Craspedostauros australis TaxID=1486917 RepID=A0A7R9ZJN8_9STRA